MTAFSQRAAHYLQFADALRALDAGDATTIDRLEEMKRLLARFVADPSHFPAGGFPLKPGTPGGLFRLVEYPDHRATVYVSLGVTGRKQPPHRHRAWALVAGVTGGIETNHVYRFTPTETANVAKLDLARKVDVGPGDVAGIETGEYHTIEVISDTPVLHVHAYGHSVDDPDYFAPAFQDSESGIFENRSNAGFDPPFARVTAGELRDDLTTGTAAILLADQPLPAELAAASNVLDVDPADVKAALSRAQVPVDVPLVVVGTEAVAQGVAREAMNAGHPLVFILV